MGVYSLNMSLNFAKHSKYENNFKITCRFSDFLVIHKGQVNLYFLRLIVTVVTTESPRNVSCQIN